MKVCPTPFAGRPSLFYITGPDVAARVCAYRCCRLFATGWRALFAFQILFVAPSAMMRRSGHLFFEPDHAAR
jgi:hypothetical protein